MFQGFLAAALEGEKIIDLEYNRKLILEDGEEYLGSAFGYTGEKVLELVFNTSMVGYQEILSDPSYTDQAVVMTYPLIGNYGIAADDMRTPIPTIGAMDIRPKYYNDAPSNFRSERTLAQVMEQYHISGISGIDTRRLARSIRDKGSPQMPDHRCGHKSGDRSGAASQRQHRKGCRIAGQLRQGMAVHVRRTQASCGRH